MISQLLPEERAALAQAANDVVLNSPISDIVMLGGKMVRTADSVRQAPQTSQDKRFHKPAFKEVLKGLENMGGGVLSTYKTNTQDKRLIDECIEKVRDDIFSDSDLTLRGYLCGISAGLLLERHLQESKINERRDETQLLFTKELPSKIDDLSNLINQVIVSVNRINSSFDLVLKKVVSVEKKSLEKDILEMCEQAEVALYKSLHSFMKKFPQCSAREKIGNNPSLYLSMDPEERKLMLSNYDQRVSLTSRRSKQSSRR